MQSPVYSNEIVVGQTPRIERRSHPRFSFCATAEAVDVRSRSVLKARVSDIGRGGCYIDAFSPFPTQTPVQLRITNNRRTFETTAQVVNSQIGMGMGLQFCATPPEQVEVLDNWLEELGEGIVEAAPVKDGAAAAESRVTENDLAAAQAAEARSAITGEQWLVLHELVIALMRKRVLSQHEGQTLLKHLFDSRTAS